MTTGDTTQAQDTVSKPQRERKPRVRARADRRPRRKAAGGAREAIEASAAARRASDSPYGFGDAVLTEARAFASRFIVAPESVLDVIVLWAAHTHAIQAFTTTPRLALMSNEPGAGKTRVLNVLKLLSRNALEELDPTGPTIAKTIRLSPLC